MEYTTTDYIIAAILFFVQFVIIAGIIYKVWRNFNHPDPGERNFHREIWKGGGSPGFFR